MADLTRYLDYKTILCVNILIFSEGKVLLTNRTYLLGQFIFDQQDKLIEKKIQIF